MKKSKTKKTNMNNFFNEMAYEMAGDLGAVDNEDMLNNTKLTQDSSAYNRSKNNHQNKNKG